MTYQGPPFDFATRPVRLADAQLAPGDSVNYLSEPGTFAVITFVSAVLVGSAFDDAVFSINNHTFFQPFFHGAPDGLENFSFPCWIPWDENEHVRVGPTTSATLSYTISGFYYVP